MATLREISNAWRKVEADFIDIVGESLERNEDSAAEYNRRQLNEEGIDKMGQLLTPAYSFATVAIKREKGQEADFVTLRDTGAYQRGFFLRVKGDSFEMLSSDSKMGELVAKYGDEHLGLTAESKRQLYIGIIKPDIVKAIARRTGAKYV